MPKTLCLDTNVVLHDAESIFKFEDNNVVIPITCIEEIDKFKREQNELGRNARAFSRYMDDLRQTGSLINGVTVNDQGGKLYVVLFDQTVANCLPYQDMSVMDNRILATAKYLKTFFPLADTDMPYRDVILITKDTNLRIKADVHSIIAQDYENGKVQSDDVYSGIRHITVPQKYIDSIYEKGMLDDIELAEYVQDTLPNECFVFHADSNSKQSALARYNGIMREFRLLPQDMKTCDILPKNTEQTFALDMLKDDDLSLVSMIGKPGAGKTIIALAAGLHGVMETDKYSKILLLKPIVAMDNSHELGFLPGSMEEKLGPWMASYADNIEVIMSKYLKEDDAPRCRNTKDKKTGKDKVGKDKEKIAEILAEKDAGKTSPIQELIAHGLLEFGSLEHARGRSLSGQYVILDECQNCSPHAVKTMITRMGEGSKIVLMGDISQIDSPYLDSRSNGLSIVVDKFQEQNISGHITLKKSERSKLAEIASELL